MTAGFGGGGGLGCEAWLTHASRTASQQDHVDGQTENKVTEECGLWPAANQSSEPGSPGTGHCFWAWAQGSLDSEPLPTLSVLWP